MKSEKILNALEQIDEIYILEAMPKVKDYKMEEKNMKNNIINLFRRPAAAVATIAICISLSGAAVLAVTGVKTGFFKDIFRWDGAVVGTTYEQATEEIDVKIIEMAEELKIEVKMLYPEKAPYKYMENLGIKSYKIIDMNGEVVIDGEETELVEIIDRKAVVNIELDNFEEEKYKLIIDEIISNKKGDAGLIIKGNWKCEF